MEDQDAGLVSRPGTGLRVAYVTSEAVPFAKTGGLADVSGALPVALSRLGVEISLFLPAYSEVAKSLPESDRIIIGRFPVPVGSHSVECLLQRGRLPHSDIPIYLIAQPQYFNRSGLYGEGGQDYPDNCERFVFYGRAVLAALELLELQPDIIHCHDWQTGLIPVYLREQAYRYPSLASAGTLLTIHNMAYQGQFDPSHYELTGLGWERYNWRQLEFHGQLSLLKAGLVYSDRLNTVSPTYAREIQTPEFGCGLEGLLSSRSADLSGIVNGIDTSIWNPSRDPHLVQRYDRETCVEGKAACKADLQSTAGLPQRTDVPLLAQIGRLDPQKGWELLAEVADELLSGGIQMVVLGVGQPRYHHRLEELMSRHHGKVHAFLEFSPALAHQIEAGADMFLMPSLYEPCGLNQLYSLVYGTVPIVRATGDSPIRSSTRPRRALPRGPRPDSPSVTPNPLRSEERWIARSIPGMTERPGRVWSALACKRIGLGPGRLWSMSNSIR